MNAPFLLRTCKSASARHRPQMRPLPSQRYNTPANRPVVGVDDAGVGAIAGPVFAAAVLLPTNWQPSMAAVDSKTLSLEARRAAFEAVCATPGLVWATAAVRARQVDTMGGHPATALAMEQAVARLEAKLRRRQFGLDCPAPDRSLSPAPRVFCLVDGPTLPIGLEGVALPGGDGTEAAIAAASVVASGGVAPRTSSLGPNPSPTPPARATAAAAPSWPTPDPLPGSSRRGDAGAGAAAPAMAARAAWGSRQRGAPPPGGGARAVRRAPLRLLPVCAPLQPAHGVPPTPRRLPACAGPARPRTRRRRGARAGRRGGGGAAAPVPRATGPRHHGRGAGAVSRATPYSAGGDGGKKGAATAGPVTLEHHGSAEQRGVAQRSRPRAAKPAKSRLLLTNCKPAEARGGNRPCGHQWGSSSASLVARSPV